MKELAIRPPILDKYKILLILGIVLGLSITLQISLSPERILKRDREIDRIYDKTQDDKVCEQYALVAREDGWYTCFKCEIRDRIYLHEAEIRKYGKTCNGQEGRYSSGMPSLLLEYVPQFFGTEQECLIEEKRKIYAYPNLPECLKREFVLLRPPGNKIDR